MELNPGTRIRDYEVVRQIGSGGMGEVWLAHEIMLDREVAIKRLNFELTRDQQFAARFQNEARIQAKLNHPNIVGMHAFFEEAGQYYMVLEYARGITLRELIDRTGPIPEQRTLNIFNQIAAALGYAHANGIIHRDVKPSNIMVDPDNQDHVKMMDFGIARLVSEGHLTRTGTRLGTMHYMSPEQVLAEKDIDARSDVYSAGVVLYEMLSGRLPFNADTDSEYVIQNKIVTEEIPDPRNVYPGISESSVSLLRSLTQKRREYRPESIARALDRMESRPARTYNRPVGEPEQPTVAGDDVPFVPMEVSKPKTVTLKPKRTWKSYWLIYLAAFVILAYLLIRLIIGESVFLGQQVKANQSSVTTPQMIEVTGGSFQMGSTDGLPDEKPVHTVTVSSFLIGKCEVTQKEWMEVMGSNPSHWTGDDLPVENVTWYEAVEYCNRLSSREGLNPCYSGSGESISCDWSANGYRLPTEAEWEFAARGGNLSNHSEFSGSGTIGSVAWYESNSSDRTHSVGSKRENVLGIHDMTGNVIEWCWDRFGKTYYNNSPELDPHGVGAGPDRVLRGGAWNLEPNNCRVAFRSNKRPHDNDNYRGFRLARANF